MLASFMVSKGMFKLLVVMFWLWPQAKMPRLFGFGTKAKARPKPWPQLAFGLAWRSSKPGPGQEAMAFTANYLNFFWPFSVDINLNKHDFRRSPQTSEQAIWGNQLNQCSEPTQTHLNRCSQQSAVSGNLLRIIARHLVPCRPHDDYATPDRICSIPCSESSANTFTPAARTFQSLTLRRSMI
ncbi:hypothetical protein B0H13DRAFT_2041990 [Mycena leptocephala]|nr:hypothetical protein B0H13DRAFT_2041990 [Mycena leptocephala]